MSEQIPKLGIGVGVMAKAPELGKVKTRLAKSIGDKSALGIYEELLLRVEREIAEKSKSDDTSGIGVHLFIEPPEKTAEVARLYPRFASAERQPPGNLGERMESALKWLLMRYEKAVLIGVDIPDLKLTHILDASSALEGVDAVFSPATDGGYSLIGVKSIIPRLLSDVPWSSSDTLKKTLNICRAERASYALIEPLADLDTLEDFSEINWRPGSPELQSLIKRTEE